MNIKIIKYESINNTKYVNVISTDKKDKYKISYSLSF